MVHLLLVIIYLAFISLGLPDSLLGAAWPTMHAEMGVPLSYAGVISMIIAGGTIVSSLQSDRLTRRFGTGKVTAFSVATTAAALFGFSMTRSFWLLCLWAVPYGLGAGSVDASLNNYVALHYKSRHMSWLHCMWGVGAMTGPYLMGYALTNGHGWNAGYRYIGIIQVVLTAILFISLPLWKGGSDGGAEKQDGGPMKLRQIFAIPGAKAVMLCFFCYCAIEQTASLWASTYLSEVRGMSPEQAAGLASLFFIGITLGRGFSGFLTMRFTDPQMIRMGCCGIALGILAMLLPGPDLLAMGGLILIGLGCAPIYPCIIHSTPAHFGADRSQAVIGVQMASAYVGTLAMPPLFGLLAGRFTVGLMPIYLAALLVIMIVMHTVLEKKAPA